MAEHAPTLRWRLGFRLIVGLLQGIALALLVGAARAKHWPASDPYIFAPAFIVAIFWPPILIVSCNMRRALALAVWVITLAVLLGLAVYSVWRVGSPDGPWPSPTVMLWLPPLLFISYALIASGDADGRLVAAYPTYFDGAWKLLLQLAYAFAFTGLLWIILAIGAALFSLIGIDVIRHLFINNWFRFPVTALAWAYAIEITDVRVGLVRGVRTLALTLQSWILPVMTLLASAFLIALLFTGVEPLWKTRSAAALLLVATALLVFLINAGYQDGQRADGKVPFIVAWAGRLGAIILVPLVGLATYALYLRIEQYGWTPSRVIASACDLTASCFAIGYLIAAVNPKPWLKLLEPTNVAVAFLVVVEILLLLSPIADPARLSVKSQLARLSSGQMSADVFDYDFLRFHSGRFGREALQALAQKGIGTDPQTVAERALAALKRQRLTRRRQPEPADPASLVTVYPEGTQLPASFFEQDWSKDSPVRTPSCLRGFGKCDAFQIDFDGDGVAEIVVAGQPNPTKSPVVYRKDSEGHWQFIGWLSGVYIGRRLCPGVLAALKSGDFSLAPSTTKDIVANGARVSLSPACPSMN